MNASHALILHWRYRVHRVQIAHYDSARKYERSHLLLGIPTILLGTIVGTSVFASLHETVGQEFGTLVTMALGALSMLSAGLAGMQTFLRREELAEKHRMAAARAIGIKHEIELLATMPPASEEETVKTLKAIEQHWAKFREEAPNIPQRIWDHIEKTLTYEKHEQLYAFLEVKA